jgi:hypothetical protein
MIDQLLFRIGEFEIEPASRRLRRRDGMTIHLASRPFQALLYLIVYEDSLTRCLSSVHQAIADRRDA